MAPPSLRFLNPMTAVKAIWRICYIFVQYFVIALYKPPAPKTDGPLKSPSGRIAVIGAGLTGVSSAAHCIAHNFEVTLFEAGPRSSLGGIWSHVNSTSGLQLNSHLYRFHPAVLWKNAFPSRDEILGEVRRIWHEYKLESRTRFETRVTSVRRADAKSSLGHRQWIINDDSETLYDAVIATVGTCGKPKWIHIDGMPKSDKGSGSDSGHGNDAQENGVFTKPIIHSSELDSESISEETIKGKRVVVIGSGASGVEAVETALQRGAGETVILARTDKWIIPRNIFFDTFVACQPFGREMPLSFLWERFLKFTHYRGVTELIPWKTGLFEGTPIVNDAFMKHVRDGSCKYVRGDTIKLTPSGVHATVRGRESKPGDDGKEEIIDADVIVLATGFEKPSIDFLDNSLFPDGYERPNLYLQNFSTEDWSVLMTNSSYMSAIGTVGHFHIGIYTRILLTFLMDEGSRPEIQDMKLWVDVVRFLKRGAKGGALGFFTYAELTIWLLLFHLLRLDRLRWLFFIMCGWGVYLKGGQRESAVEKVVETAHVSEIRKETVGENGSRG
ncbi:unnamed protein product [Mycena citricolor]|uniref:FAD/NAD(P)-binding domain-containing protein n=1 Tax=Mycena citricolor TaxID=2018698 RepID=A0AAD2HP25_9AGAR|nr:unnamed protein product [Mycena citricolor]